MSSGQKVFFSFLSTLLLFAGFVYFAHTGLMSEIETKFYVQAKVAEKQEIVDKLNRSCDSYITNILSKIQSNPDGYLNASSVKSYVHQNPSEKDEIDRRNLTTNLFDSLSGLDGMRLVEKNGRNVHFSTFADDILNSNGLNRVYKTYTDIQKDSDELSTELVLLNQNSPETKILLDKNHNRFVFAFPFYITDNTYFGTLLCYVSFRDFEKHLLSDNAISLGDNIELIVDETTLTGGFVLGVPKEFAKEFDQPVKNTWKTRQKQLSIDSSLDRILEIDNNSYWVMMQSSQKGKYFNVSAVYQSSEFQLTRELECLIYICIFTTLFILFFLLFSLKRDYVTVMKAKIKKIQFEIINECLEKNKEKNEWSQIARQIENRKIELSDEIKKSIHGKSKKHAKQVDSYLDSSWKEIISILKFHSEEQTGNISGASLEEIRKVIEDVLKSTKVNVASVQSSVVTPEPYVPQPQTVSSLDDAEVLDEVESLDDAEVLDEVESLDDAELLDEVESLDDAEVLDEVESLDDAEVLDEVESLDDAEVLDEVESLDDAEVLDEVESLDDAEVLDEVESLDDAEVLDEVESLDDAEVLDEVESLDDAEVIDEVESLDDAEVLDEVESLDDAEVLDEVESLDDAELLEEVESLDDVELLEEVESLEIIEEENSGNFGLLESPRMSVYLNNNETFVGDTDEFATVDNIFAEELRLGIEYTSPTNKIDNNFTFTASVPGFGIIPDIFAPEVESTEDENNEDDSYESEYIYDYEEEEVSVNDEELEVLTQSEYISEEDYNKFKNRENLYFSMTAFAANNNSIELLDSEDSIIEKDGVYSISPTAKYDDIVQDLDFKSLVDSVLR